VRIDPWLDLASRNTMLDSGMTSNVTPGITRG